MINKVKCFIKNNFNLPRNAKIALAFSYGIDSTCLLDILLKLNYEVVLCHVNHKHRPESELEEKAAIDLADKLGLKIYIHHLNENKLENFHNDAHHKRYKFFLDVAKRENIKYIATAHHQSDNLETILMNLISGSNMYGYSGIAPEIVIDDVSIIRPLLALSKDEIKQYQKDNNLLFFEDSSNSTNEFTRNRIRHNVIPNLMKENPSLYNNISNYSNIIRDAFSYIRSQSIRYINKWDGQIAIDEYKSLDRSIRTDIISYILEQNDISKNFALIVQINDLLMSNKPQGNIALSNNFVFKKRYSHAFLQKHEKDTYFEYKLFEENVIYTKNYRFYFTKILPSSDVKYLKLCYNRLVFPLTLRTRKPGDIINMQFGHKKVKDLMIDAKVPIEERNEALLLLNDNTILWISDIAKSRELCDMKNNGDIYLVYEVLK